MEDTERLVNERHSVRNYLDKPIEKEKAEALLSFAAQCAAEGGIGISLVCDEPQAFSKFILPYGRLNAANYFVLYAKPGMDEQIGYFGEKIVLYAQSIGLNTCWVAGSFSKKYVNAKTGPKDKIYALIAVGYGKDGGKPRRSKTYRQVSLTQDAPDWYRRGVEFALKAPTAINQQSFKFELAGEDTVRAVRTIGVRYTKIDLGIVKYHFELGAARKINWV